MQNEGPLSIMKRPGERIVDPDAVPAAPVALKVAREFKTHNRRFRPGDNFSPADLAGSALDLDHLKDTGFVVAA